MGNKNKFSLIIIMSALLLVLLLAGLSYAYWSNPGEGTESSSTVVVSGGALTIHYEDLTDEINLVGIYPKEEAWATKNFRLTGRNTTTATMNYKLGINVISNTFSEDALTYNITNTNKATAPGTPIADNANKPINKTSGTVWIGAGQYGTGENMVHEYSVEIFFKENEEDQSENMGAKFNAKIVVDEAATGDLSPDWWLLADEGSLIAGIKSNNGRAQGDNAFGMTTPGVEVATGNENLRKTEDDYGTSYYFRGNYVKNFVSFADMCWRIVRIDGQGNIKLVLYNYLKESDRASNATYKDNPCASVYDGPDRSFARYTTTYANSGTGAAGTSTFKINNSLTNPTNATIGYMYGASASANAWAQAGTYDWEHANVTKSGILKNLEVWYNANLSSYSNKLADVIWCNDKSLGSTGTGIGNVDTTYAAYDRLNPATTARPTLVCPDASGTDPKLSKFTVNDKVNGNGALDVPIGLLTADEVAFAGAVFGTANTDYYLYKNATQTHWWTLSPANYTYGGNVWNVHSSEGRLRYASITEAYGMRPAVALKPSVSISGGNGTQETPFVIS